MDFDDKLEYYQFLVKNLNESCNRKCFDSANLNKCIDICYNKYIIVMNKVEKLNLKYGNKNESELVSVSYEKDHNWNDFIFRYGGTPQYSQFFFPKRLEVDYYPLEGKNPFKHKDLWR